MKVKYLIGGLFMAVLGGAISIFAYTKIFEKPAVVTAKDSSKIEIPAAQALLASYQVPQTQVDFSYAAEQTVHAVVHVMTKTMVSQSDNPIMQWFYGDRAPSRPREQTGYGSGVIISPDGYIITNNHVIEDAENIQVTLNDNREFKAELVGRDPNTDIAVLKIKADDLTWLKYGDSEALKVGQWVLAVGNPFNLTSTVTAGIVSAKGRNLRLIDSDYSIESYIQTDAALNPGNSGGALVNTQGQLVGITSAIYSPSGAYAGNSFAIPVTIVKKVVDDILKFGTVQRAIMGIKMTEVTPDDAKAQNLTEVKGAIITEVTEGGSAAEAKLKAKDIITKINGINIASTSELQEQVGTHRPGDRITVTYFRDGKEYTAPLVLKNIAGNTNVVTKGMSVDEIFGARFESLSSDEKDEYNVPNGVKILEVNDGLFKDMGFKKGTVIVSINGKKVSSADDVRNAAGTSAKSLKTIEGMTSDGRYFNYRFGN